MSVDLTHRPAVDDTVALAPVPPVAVPVPETDPMPSVAPALPAEYRWARCDRHGEAVHRVGALASVWVCARCDNDARGLPREPLPRRPLGGEGAA